MEGETPDVPDTPIDELIDSQADANFWDPSTQLRVVKKKGKVPAYPDARSSGARRLGRLMLDLGERLAELRASGLDRRLRVVEGPQGPAVELDGRAGAAALLEQLPRARRPPGRAARRRRRRARAGARAPAPRA